MLNFNPQGKRVILAVDGGGMRGMISIAMLAELEAMTGKPCAEMFDMVGGTSTGALIAAGIGVGMTAAEILTTIYRDRLPKAFGSGGIMQWIRYAMTGFRNIHPIGPFLEAMEPLARGYKIRDLTHPIVFMTTKDVRVGDTYFIVSKGPGLPAVADWPLAGAVAASASAPVYFPPTAGNLVDGGVGVTANPCLAVAIEAMEYIGAEYGFADKNVILISLGTGYVPYLFGDGAASRFWLKNWIQYVITEGMGDANLQQASSTRAIYGNRIDFRRYNPQMTRESLSKAFGITSAIDPTKIALDSHAPEQIALMEEVGRAYARTIDWLKPSVMPWDTPGGQTKPNVSQADVDWSKTPFA